jgi:hypothetical protein
MARALGLVLLAGAHAQIEREYFMRTPPYPVYQGRVEEARYNLKLGNMTARFGANVQVELNDNINLSERSPQADLSIGPQVTVGFLLPLTKHHLVQLDLSGGYRYYLRNGAASSINIAPNTHLDYTIYIEGVRVTLHDRFSIQVDPVGRGELSGRPDVVAFRRLVNVSGFVADWQPTRDWGFTTGYDFTLDRSLNETFQELDRNDHTVFLGANYTVSTRVKTGVLATYSLSKYQQRVQNDGQTWTIGPTLSAKLSRFLTANASAGYTISTYQRTGLVQDDSAYRGATYQVGIEHQPHRLTTHELRFSQSVGLGFGGNFTDTWTLQYGIKTTLTRAITLHGTFAFENLKNSGPNAEESNRYLLYLGTGYRFTRLWSVGISYSTSLRDSSVAGNGYLQNRLTLDLTRRF